MKRCINIPDELVKQTEDIYGKLTNGVIEQWIREAIKKEIKNKENK